MLPEVLLQLHHDLMQRAMVAEQAEAAERAARVAAEARVAESRRGAGRAAAGPVGSTPLAARQGLTRGCDMSADDLSVAQEQEAFCEIDAAEFEAAKNDPEQQAVAKRARAHYNEVAAKGPQHPRIADA